MSDHNYTPDTKYVKISGYDSIILPLEDGTKILTLLKNATGLEGWSAENYKLRVPEIRMEMFPAALLNEISKASFLDTTVEELRNAKQQSTESEESS